MKIIGTSNFDDEFVSDKLICTGVDKFWGERLVKLLNESSGESSYYFYKLVDDEYELYKFEP
jgi:hypothetical protein